MTDTKNSEVAIIGTREAAEILKMPRRTLAYRASKGITPSIGKVPGVSGSYLFDRETIEALAKAGNDA